MAIIETYYMKIWMGGDGKPLFEIVDYFRWARIKFDHGYLRTFKGKRATVATFTEDTEITREMALKCVSDWMDGKYVTISVNLAKLSSSSVEGSPH